MPSLYAPMSGVNTKQKSVWGLMSGVNTKQKNGFGLMSGVNTKVFSSGVKWTYAITITSGSHGYTSSVSVPADYTVSYALTGTDDNYYTDHFNVLFTFNGAITLPATSSMFCDLINMYTTQSSSTITIAVNDTQVASFSPLSSDQTISLGAETLISTIRISFDSTISSNDGIGKIKLTLYPVGGNSFFLNNSGVSQQ